MINKTLLLLIVLAFLSANPSWAGFYSSAGLSICSLNGAVFADAEDEKKKEGEEEEEPDCE